MIEFMLTVTTFFGFGVVLDYYFAGRIGKQRLEKFLKEPSSENSLLLRLQNFLTVSKSLIFERLFSGKVGSARFLLSSALLSVSVFLAASAIQVYTKQGLADDFQLSVHQLVLILVLLGCNFILDYFTIAQTVVFLDAAIRAKSIFRSLLFIISDILVTINVFILLFSAIVLGLMQFYYTPTNPAQLSFVEIGSGDAREREESHVFGLSYILDKTKDDWREFAFSYDGSRVLTAEQFVAILPALTSLTFEKISVSPSSADVFESVVAELTSQENQLLNRIIGEAASSDSIRVSEIDLLVSGSGKSFNDIHMAYTNIFMVVDAVEDSFPTSLAPTMPWISISELRRLQDDTYFLPSTAVLSVCSSADGEVQIGFVEAVDQFDRSKCVDWLLVSQLSRGYLRHDVVRASTDLDAVYVPYGILFITSVLPTLLFYISAFVVACLTFANAFAKNWLKRDADLIIRSPFTFVLTLLGAIGWLVGVFNVPV